MRNMSKRYSNKYSKKAFTLSEVLITLAIIGVVAALTIPNLMAKNAKAEQVVALKSVYSDISQALKLMMVDEGVSKVSDTNILTYDEVEDYNISKQRIGDQFLKKYFKVAKDCGTTNPSTCFAEDYKDIAGGSSGGAWPAYSIITAGGSSIGVTPAGSTTSGSIVIDTNGLKPPNVIGRDLFSFSFYYDGSLDVVTPECKKGIPNLNAGLCNGSASNASELRDLKFQLFFVNNKRYLSYGGFGKILNDGWKMDY